MYKKFKPTHIHACKFLHAFNILCHTTFLFLVHVDRGDLNSVERKFLHILSFYRAVFLCIEQQQQHKNETRSKVKREMYARRKI